MKNIAYISLGSNLDDPALQILQALKALSKTGDIIGISKWYQSKAVGPGTQADFINGVIKLSTVLPPFSLLDKLQQIEQQQGRTREIHWGARTLDLDILLFNRATIHSRRLTVPHPRIIERNFVIRPLLDIDRKLTLPADDTPLINKLANCDENPLTVLAEPGEYAV